MMEQVVIELMLVDHPNDLKNIFVVIEDDCNHANAHLNKK